MRILVADDHEFFRESVARFLRELGATEVVVAADGQTALLQAQEHTPDLAILDRHLPGTDLSKLSRRIQSASPTTQIVLCSDNDEPAASSSSLTYLLKDDLFEQLPKLIHQLFPNA